MAMPFFRLVVQMPTGQVVTYWTQDPEGMASDFREGGLFVSSDTPLEDPPTAS